MLGFVITAMIAVSIIQSLISDSAQSLSAAVLSGGGNAVSLCISLAGAMGFWGGMMKVADRCGITRAIAKILGKPLGILFKTSDQKTLELISLNVTANLLGLGNAATPIGIRAMKQLYKTEKCRGRNTALFILLNTASVQLIPMTVSSMRLSHGAANPWDCTLPTVITSIGSVAVGCVAISLIYSRKKGDCR